MLKRMPKLTIILSSIGVLLLSGCAKTLVHTPFTGPSSADNMVIVAADQVTIPGTSATLPKKVYPLFADEARLWDIPFVVDATTYCLHAEQRDRKLILCSDTQLSSSDVMAFYRTQMECLGWEEKAALQADESCAVFEKRSKYCVITVRENMTSGCRIILFIHCAYLPQADH